MATTDQKYLDPGLFLTAPFTSAVDAIPIVIIDPATNNYSGAGPSPIIDDTNAVSKEKYMPIVFVDPNTGNAV